MGWFNLISIRKSIFSSREDSDSANITNERFYQGGILIQYFRYDEYECLSINYLDNHRNYDYPSSIIPCQSVKSTNTNSHQ